jgi:uncharacterized protein YbjT (DUF2867 family)
MITSLSIEDAASLAMGKELHACEDLIAAGDIAWTFIRPGDFHSNVYRWLPQIRSEGVVCAGYGNYPTAPIDPADIAAVAVKTLTEAGHDGQVYPVTGPSQITPEEQTRIIAELIGRPLRFEIATFDEAVATLRCLGVEEARARETVDGLRRPDLPWSRPRPTVEVLMGRPGTTFRAWAERHVDRLS